MPFTSFILAVFLLFSPRRCRPCWKTRQTCFPASVAQSLITLASAPLERSVSAWVSQPSQCRAHWHHSLPIIRPFLKTVTKWPALSWTVFGCCKIPVVNTTNNLHWPRLYLGAILYLFEIVCAKVGSEPDQLTATRYMAFHRFDLLRSMCLCCLISSEISIHCVFKLSLPDWGRKMSMAH